MNSYPFNFAHNNCSEIPKRETNADIDQGFISTDLRKWLCGACKSWQPYGGITGKSQPTCSTCQLVVSFIAFLVEVEEEPDVEYEYYPIYDPLKDPDEVNWNWRAYPDPWYSFRVGYYDD